MGRRHVSFMGLLRWLVLAGWAVALLGCSGSGDSAQPSAPIYKFGLENTYLTMRDGVQLGVTLYLSRQLHQNAAPKRQRGAGKNVDGQHSPALPVKRPITGFLGMKNGPNPYMVSASSY